ncbi:protein of unknown function [Serratia sp. Tan611]|nr:protein of unknown function [Serratia sp. Tan611]
MSGHKALSLKRINRLAVAGRRRPKISAYTCLLFSAQSTDSLIEGEEISASFCELKRRVNPLNVMQSTRQGERQSKSIPLQRPHDTETPCPTDSTKFHYFIRL